MRALLVVVAFAALALGCKGKQEEPAPANEDWAPRCEQAFGELGEQLDTAGVAKLIAGCHPCGDWTPILDWNRRPDAGGPTREVITRAMDRCKAFCDSTAKTYFLGTLDDARGTTSRKPWIELGKECKAATSAVPDARYMSASFFALDRIARAAVARGGELARRAGKLRVRLPAVSLTGVGPDMPAAPRPCAPAPHRHAITLLGDKTFFGDLPSAHLGSGVIIDAGLDYPGRAGDLAAMPSIRDHLLLVAPKQARAATVFDVLTAAERAELHLDLAFDCGGGIPGTIAPLVTIGADAKETIAIGDAMTVQDLANEIGKREGASLVKLVRKP